MISIIEHYGNFDAVYMYVNINNSSLIFPIFDLFIDVNMMLHSALSKVFDGHKWKIVIDPDFSHILKVGLEIK